MRCIKVSSLVAVFMLSLGSASFAQNSVAGAWELTINSPQGPQTSTLTLKQDGEKLTGELAGPMGSVPTTGTFTNDTVAVTTTISVQGMNLDFIITGKLEGEALNGTIKVGDFGEFPFTGKRAAAGAAAARPAPAPPAVSAPPAAAGSTTDATGKWDLVFNIEGVGEFPVTADLKQDGTKITGTFSGPTGDVTLQGTMTGPTLKLEFEVETPQGKMPIVITGDLGPEGFSGKATLTGMGEATWKGTRAK
jgi:hypothetical protein